MKHWKQQFRTMPVRCSIRHFLCLITTVLILLSCGCAKEPENPVTCGEWIRLINEKAGLMPEFRPEPYYVNITSSSEYFASVQTAVEWGILDTGYPFDPDQYLNRELTAYTLMNLADRHDTDIKTDIKDLSNTIYADSVKNAVASGLMHTDTRGLFHPKTIVEKQEAEALLDQILSVMNDREIQETKTEVKWDNQETPKEIEVEDFDETENTAYVQSADGIKEKDTVCFEKDGKKYLYTARGITQEEKGFRIDLEETDILSHTEQIDLSGDTYINFDNAEILTDDNTVIQKQQSAVATPQLMSVFSKTREFDTHGFHVTIASAGSSVRIEAVRKLPHGSVITGRLAVNSVQVKYSFNRKKGQEEDAYFKLSFQTEEYAGMHTAVQRTMYPDLKDVNIKSVPDLFQKFFAQNGDTAEAVIPLCRIRIPLPEAPMMDLNMKLQLSLSAQGRAELQLVQTHIYGFEIRNGKTRIIRDFSNDQNAVMKASAQVSADILFGADFLNQTLMDAGLQTGAAMSLSTVLHLFDEDGNHSVCSSAVPPDAAEEMSAGNPDVLVCADIHAGWILNLRLNSASSFLGRKGFGKSINLLNVNNAPLFPGMKTHLENFVFVDRCTRGDRMRKTDYDEIAVTKMISMDRYSLIVYAGTQETIHITGLPEGYSFEDLQFTSEDPSIASVDHTGLVKGYQEGNTVVTVSTKDRKHQVECHIMVPSEEEE